MTERRRDAAGFTLVELLLAVAIASLVLLGLVGIVEIGSQAGRSTGERLALLADAEFAMGRMVGGVQGSPRLLLPLAENPATPYSESVRDVLAVALGPGRDADRDGFPDADNDRDGRIDEDPGADENEDGKAGIAGIDDDGDGQIDENHKGDDDEDEDQTGARNEEIVNGVDDDGDGNIDEDPAADRSQDGAAGLAGVDDDGDTLVDEGNPNDDDEEDAGPSRVDEDWIDTLAWFRQSGELVERLPLPHASDGEDYVESPIASAVSFFQVERLAPPFATRAQVVRITLELTGPGGESVRLVRSVRVGGRL